MGKIAKFSTPLLFQSKLFCFSLFYLFSSLFFALYFSISSTKCLFRSSPFDPLHLPLFTYPSSYGEHKHAIPTSRSSCDSPIHFSEYPVVLREIERLFADSKELGLRYMQGKGNATGFGGNMSFPERFSYFDRGFGTETEIPCGFFKRFPVSDSDRISMEKCDGMVVVSAVFNDHDKIRQPRGLGSETLNRACFFMFVDDSTIKGLQFHNIISKNLEDENRIGVWRIVKVYSDELYENPAMNGVIPKYLIHRLFPNSKFSVWVDAKLQLVVDPFLLIHSLVVEQNFDMAISRHPFFVHTMEEAMATARWKKWRDVNALKIQMETYCQNGMQPWNSTEHYPTDVPDSALILRKHTTASNAFSCLLFNELDGFNPRDQLPFAFVRDHMHPKLKLNMFEFEIFEQIAIEYRHNIKQGGARGGGPKSTRTTFNFYDNETCGKCDGYLSKMWDHSHD